MLGAEGLDRDRLQGEWIAESGQRDGQPVPLERIEMQDPNYGWTVEMQIKAARLGLRKWQLDPGWYAIRLMKAVRLISRVKVPTREQMAAKKSDYAAFVEPGNVVQPGKELMALAPAGETQIVVQIDEKNLAQLKLGQQALASADAFPKERFAAELVYINPGIDALRGSVEVKLRVREPPAYLRQDMTVSVDIEVARSRDTVVAPADAVRDANGDQPWVLAVNGWRAERRPVKLGLKGDGRIEVLDGVAPGDRLILATEQTVRAGQRVRAVAADRRM